LWTLKKQRERAGRPAILRRRRDKEPNNSSRFGSRQNGLVCLVDRTDVIVYLVKPIRDRISRLAKNNHSPSELSFFLLVCDVFYQHVSTWTTRIKFLCGLIFRLGN
jgi:hypothetical protein